MPPGKPSAANLMPPGADLMPPGKAGGRPDAPGKGPIADPMPPGKPSATDPMPPRQPTRRPQATDTTLTAPNPELKPTNRTLARWIRASWWIRGTPAPPINHEAPINHVREPRIVLT
jgi:hypothetical protein